MNSENHIDENEENNAGRFEAAEYSESNYDESFFA